MNVLAKVLLPAAGIILASQSLFADISLKTDDIAGVTLYYKVITPKDYDPAKEYPAVIAFPGGAQTMPMVDGMIARNLSAAGAKARLHRGGLFRAGSGTVLRGRGSGVPRVPG